MSYVLRLMSYVYKTSNLLFSNFLGVSIMAKQDQFRPSLCSTEIIRLLTYIPIDDPLYKKFAMFQVKIQVGLVQVSHTKSNLPRKDSLEGRLGFTSQESLSNLSEDHLANQRVIMEQLETKAKFAPQLMSDSDRLEYLGQKSIAEDISEEELVEGRALELKIHGMSFGIFD